MRPDPFRNYQFNLLIEGVQTAGFIEAVGLGADIDVIEYREAGGMVRHLPGRVHYRPITLSYGVGVDRTLWDWFDQITAGDIQRRNVSVIQYAPDGISEAHRWNLDQAWPSQFGVAPMESQGNNIAIETLTLVYDRMERD